MSRTVTLRLDEPVYRSFRSMAERENRPVSNFIETAVLRFMEEHRFVDEFEGEEIRRNRGLNRSLRKGIADARRRRGSFA